MIALMTEQGWEENERSKEARSGVERGRWVKTGKGRGGLP